MSKISKTPLVQVGVYPFSEAVIFLDIRTRSPTLTIVKTTCLWGSTVSPYGLFQMIDSFHLSLALVGLIRIDL